MSDGSNNNNGSGRGGFLPDLANWALRGGAAAASHDNDETTLQSQQASDNNNSSSNNPTAEEMRAQRLARLGAMQTANATGDPEPMEIDPPERNSTPKKKKENEDPAPVSPPRSPPLPTPPPVSKKEEASPQKKRSKNEAVDTIRKVQRKKEALLRKIFSIALKGSDTTAPASSSPSSSSYCTIIDIDSTEVTIQSIAEILAVRLSLPTSSVAVPLIPYLASCHRKASEELKNSKQSNSNKQLDADSQSLLQEMQNQVVSYAASCLMEPDLFEQGGKASLQLAQALANAAIDPASSIVFGVNGSSTSFYYLLVEELIQQDASVLDRLVADVTSYLIGKLKVCDSVLDNNDNVDDGGGGGGPGSPILLVAALTSLCLHKRAAHALTQLPAFGVPAADTREARQQMRPPLPNGGGGANLLQMLALGQHQPYLHRSGPGIEKETVLGLALRMGMPKNNNAAFSPTSILRQSLDVVERTTSSQRQQLKIHQDACYQLVMAIIKGGPEARKQVMQWFVDALLLNSNASAMRPDPSKVSSSNMLLNMSIILLKLCEPFVNDENKQHLIDPGFVSSPTNHAGVYATLGDQAVARLGEEPGVADGTTTTMNYSPKNSFIPQCFFLCARSLHYGIAPLLSSHNNLLRHIAHVHYEITNNSRDLQTDPHFSILVSKQRSNEVALFQEEMVTDTLRFCNCMAKFLYNLPDDVLRTMPEDFVSDTCDIIVSIAKLKAKLLRNIEFRNVFQLVVKLLSTRYADMVRNYNLRAMLGDILYELFLPTTSSDRRDMPESVATDNLAGGQPYLIADKTAQETLAPSLLLLYGEVEQTGYYDKMSHRAKIASLIKFLWESDEHRPAFRHITQNKESFIKFANGMMNETNALIATVMQKLPEIREAQEQMRNSQEWGQLTEDEQGQVSSRLDDNEREVRHALPLCNKTLQMFGYLNTDSDIRQLFLLDELCPRLVTMLLHVLTKLVGSKGLDLKVDNPEQYDFRPKEMLRDLCAIFALFSPFDNFCVECAKAGCDPQLLHSAVKTCRRLNLLKGYALRSFEALPDRVQLAQTDVAADEALLTDAPDEFMDELLNTYMVDPVKLPSGHVVDRSTITQHLLNNGTDPFNREPMTVESVTPATELKLQMQAWLANKKRQMLAEAEGGGDDDVKMT